MPNYRRFYSGRIWFFTVVTHERMPILSGEKARGYLRIAIDDCRSIYPFNVIAWVLLPDHLHCMWDMTDDDVNYSRRWSIIKRKFTQGFAEKKTPKPPFWQKRFWAHQIMNEKDYEDHLNYIHSNPVKHGYVESPGEWAWTSFHRLVKAGVYSPNRGEQLDIPDEVGRE